jgi:ABC-2 type transport system permease protein
MDYQQELMKNNAIPLRIVPETANVVQSRIERSNQLCARRNGIGANADLCDDDFRFHSSGKRNRHNGSAVSFTFQSLFGYHFKSHSVFVFVVNQSYDNSCIKHYAFGYAYKWQRFTTIRNKHLVDYLRFVFGLIDFKRTQSQQAAMLISMMGMLVPTMLFTGFMFPIENMPVPLQVICNLIPSKWYYTIVKSIMIKGLGFSAIWKEILVLFGMTCFLLVVSFKKFKTRLV